MRLMRLIMVDFPEPVLPTIAIDSPLSMSNEMLFRAFISLSGYSKLIFLKDILTATKTIAMVGLSMNETRPSYFVGRYLHTRGYKIIPVNAGHGGKHFFGQLVRSSIDEIDEPVDMVDIFRKPEAVPEIVDDSLAKLKGLKTIWMQIGIKHESSAQKARQLGLNVIEDRCPKIEHQRLFGELRKAGFATNIISSRL